MSPSLVETQALSSDKLGEASQISQFRFVLYGGIYNSLMRNYFRTNFDTLKNEYGLRDTRMLGVDTWKSPEENAADLVTQIRLDFERGGRRPLVIVGHSAGGSYALLALLKFPELVLSGFVHKIFVVQAPVGGSPIADLIQRGFLPTVKTNWKAIFSPPLRPTLATQFLGRDFSKNLFSFYLKELRRRLSQTDYENLSSRVLYIRSRKDVDEMSLFLRETSRLLVGSLRLNGENSNQDHDGLVLAQDQYLEDFGIDLGVLYGDHSEFTGSNKIMSYGRKSKLMPELSSTEVKAAFTRALVKQIVEGGSVLKI